MNEPKGDARKDLSHPGRREVLKAALGVGCGLQLARFASPQDDAPARPRENDRLVFAFGDRSGETITPDDVVVGAEPLWAYPVDPASRQVKDDRLATLLIVRFAPGALDGPTRDLAADGILAYSAVCTHTGCDVSIWDDQTLNFVCSCHDSEFDPREGAKVLFGPAPRRLAALPLRITEGALVVAGEFRGRVGFKK